MQSDNSFINGLNQCFSTIFLKMSSSTNKRNLKLQYVYLSATLKCQWNILLSNHFMNPKVNIVVKCQ